MIPGVSSSLEPGLRGLLAALLATLAVQLLGHGGFLGDLSDTLDDSLATLVRTLDPPRPQVLLVSYPGKEGPPDLVPLIRASLAMGGRLVALLDSRSAPAPGTEGVPWDHLVVGRRLLRDAFDLSEPRLEPLPPSLPVTTSWGVLTPPRSVRAVCRRGELVARVGERREPTLIARIARTLGQAVSIDEESFPIQFLGGRASLPHLGLSHAGAGGLVPDLVRDRVVLVGPTGPSDDPGLSTPTTGDGPGMAPLEFHGHALHTLLSDRHLRTLSPVLETLLIFLLAMVAFIGQQWVRPPLTGGLALGLGGLGLAMGVAAQILFERMLPLAGLVLVPLIAWIWSGRTRLMTSVTQVSRLLFDTQAFLQRRYWPESFFVTDEHWDKVVIMVNQSLELTKLIFFVLDPGELRMRVIKETGCTADDILERRRDYRRTPFSTAIERAAPLRIDSFFKKSDEGHVHYLVPLLFAGQVEGFWFLEVDSTQLTDAPAFEAILGTFGRQIGELLYQRREMLKATHRPGLLSRLLAMEPVEDSLRRLRQSIELIEGRLSRLQDLVAGSGVATVVYDLFGRVLEVNERMLELLRYEGIAPYQMSAVDVISRLSGRDVGEARQLVRLAIFEKRPVVLPINFPSVPELSFELNLQALESRQHPVTTDQPAPFGVEGLSLQLVETTQAARLKEMKRNLSLRLETELRNDLSALKLGLPFLSDPSLDEESQRTTAALLDRKIDEALQSVRECVGFLGRESETFAESEWFPVDARSILGRASARAEEHASEKCVQIEIHSPPDLSPVLASPALLERTFLAILSLLVEDARLEGRLQVDMVDAEGTVRFIFTNTGLGLDSELMRSYLSSKTALESRDLEELRQAAARVADWGGTLQVGSRIGEGTRVELVLRKLM